MENQYFNQAQQQYFQDCREIELVKAKEVAKASVRLEAQAIKAQRKEESEERKRQIFEELCLLESGELALITRYYKYAEAISDCDKACGRFG